MKFIWVLVYFYYIVNCLLIHTCIKRHINHDYSFSAIVPIVQFDNFYQILSNLEIFLNIDIWNRITENFVSFILFFPFIETKLCSKLFRNLANTFSNVHIISTFETSFDKDRFHSPRSLCTTSTFYFKINISKFLLLYNL